jgi:hypothetical protein
LCQIRRAADPRLVFFIQSMAAKTSSYVLYKSICEGHSLSAFGELCDVHDVEREYLALRITVIVKINEYRGSD